jgi:DNA-directed RNA polymerase specialized sigma24 family protein
MRPTQSSSIKSTTPEEAFASKHAWLLRWALHFSQNDRAAAEDLVQESFVKLLLSWDSLTDLENIEPLLYSYLKYAYLTERRRGQNYSFQSLSTIDFDTLFIRLRMANQSDQLTIQNELRRIVAYLLMRRRTAKFASIFLLRFFHSYFPQDIMRVCLITRHAVDLSLRYAREDVKSFLAGADRIQEFPRPTPAPLKGHVAISTQSFAEEIRRAIFSATNDACLPVEHLRQRYNSPTPLPIDCDLLSHVVACERCLDVVNASCGLPPAAKRFPGDAVGTVPRTRNTARNILDTAKQATTSAIAEGRNRLRDIYEHHPSGLMIAINGQVLAVRDISSEHSALKVDMHSLDTLRLIEVLSEQGLTLLAFPLVQSPPDSEPEVSHRVEMSGGRQVSLVVQFTRDGALVEATYDDPSFLIGTDALSPRELSEVSTRPLPLSSAPEKVTTLLRRLTGRLKTIRTRPVGAALACVTVLLALAIYSWVGTTNRTLYTRPSALLARAVSAERSVASSGAKGVSHQRLLIRSSSRTLQRDIYRDLEGHRHPRIQPPSTLDLPIEKTLEEAGISWDSPLSAADFQQWHDHAPNRIDNIDGDGTALLTLRTTSDDPIVRMESLTVRAADFHPVKRILELRNREVIEIAELTYDIAPWSKEAEVWFEPDASLLDPARSLRVSPSFHPPLQLSEEHLDELQLHVMLTLNYLHADTERLTISRSTKGIDVKGVVETEERKLQIVTALSAISHVAPHILSYRDMEQAPTPETSPTTVSAVSVISTSSSMDAFCDSRHLDRETCRRISYQLLNAATSIVRKSNQIDELHSQFASTPSLTPEATSIGNSLLLADLADINDALSEQERVFTSLGISLPELPDAATSEPDCLVSSARRNLSRATELARAGNDPSTPAESSLAELGRSVRLLQVCLSRLPNAFPTDTTSKRSPAPQP